MRYLILEDEKLAANRLKELVSAVRPDYAWTLTIDSVEAAVATLPALQVDLVFMDIQLADGLSFEIFDQIPFDTPIIFTTAYDSFAIQAFKANSIDYLLKPLEPGELLSAIEKFEKNNGHARFNPAELTRLLQPAGKERFVVKVGEHLKTVETLNIQLIYSQDKGTYLFTKEARKYLVDYTLDKVEQLLNPNQFFRISRKFIVNLSSIKDIIAFSNSRLEIHLDHFNEERLIVARDRVNDFKKWLDR